MIVLQAQTDTRHKILAEADRLFRHYGYGKTTMADIAEACQMSPANLYRFFASKSALVEAICGEVTSSAEGRLLQIVRADESASRRLERFIAEVHRHTLENLLDHRKVHEMVVVAMEEQWHAVKAHLDRVCGHIELIIKDGIAAGEFAPQDTARAAKCVHSAMAFLCHPALVAQKLEDEDRTTPEEMARFVVHGLKANV
ncbi:MAG: TetR/AcrR family transcriptional regulator [Rhodomicrobiaceae bacterium]